MNEPTTALLAVFLVLQVKHFICDYPLQTMYQLRNKGTYGHPGGIIHSAIHIVGTSLSFLVVTPSLGLAIGILAGEFLLHYHIDWSKEQLLRRMKSTSTDRSFWWAIGFDQLLHHLTYIGIAWLLVSNATFGVAAPQM